MLPVAQKGAREGGGEAESRFGSALNSPASTRELAVQKQAEALAEYRRRCAAQVGSGAPGKVQQEELAPAAGESLDRDSRRALVAPGWR